ncbi:MAG: hypothetical protein ACYDIE_06200 [Candidatus Krumholzibacteriia bacterium]
MSECAWCGDEVTGKAVRFKNLSFCSDDCRDEWEEDAEAGEDAEFDEDELDDEFADEDDDVDEVDGDDDKEEENY